MYKDPSRNKTKACKHTKTHGSHVMQLPHLRNMIATSSHVHDPSKKFICIYIYVSQSIRAPRVTKIIHVKVYTAAEHRTPQNVQK